MADKENKGGMPGEGTGTEGEKPEGSEGSEGGMLEEGASGQSEQDVTLEGTLAELKRTRAALKAANAEAAERRKRLSALEKAEQERKDAELSEKERLEKQLAEAQQARAEAEAVVNDILLRTSVKMTAAKMNFIEPEVAYQLADLAGVEIGEDGEVSGVEKALKGLAKDKPYLLKQEQGQQPDINAGKKGKGKDGKADLEAIKRRFGI